MNHKHSISLLFLVIVFVSIRATAQNKRDLIDELNNSAFALRSIDPDSAVQLARRAWQLSEVAEYTIGSAVARVNIGNYYRTFRPDTALVILKEALVDLESGKDYKFTGAANWYIGKIFSSMSAFRKATTYFDAALEVLQKTEEHYLIAGVWNDKAIVEGKQSNYVRALEHLEQAYRLKQEHSLPTDVEANNIALVYVRMGDAPRARAILLKLLPDSDSSGLPSVYNTLGTSYQSLGSLDSAICYFEKAIQTSVVNKDRKSEIIAISNLAGVYIKMGNEKSANEKLRYAIARISPSDDYINQMIYVELAKLYKSSHKADSCMKYGYKALDAARRASSKGYAMEVSAILSSVHEQKKEYIQAINALKLHNAYRDSIDADDDKTRFNDLRLRIETFEKDQEIESLKKQQQVDRLRVQYTVVLAIALLLVVSLVFLVWLYRQKMLKEKSEIQNRLLQEQLQQKEKGLLNQKLHMIHRYNTITEIEEEIKKIAQEGSSEKYKKLLSLIVVSKSLDRDWDTFSTYFNNIHGDFVNKISAQTKNLSINERRLLMLLKMKLSNREIASLLNIEVGSVKMAKYRLKKKLQLDEFKDLEEFIDQSELVDQM